MLNLQQIRHGTKGPIIVVSYIIDIVQIMKLEREWFVDTIEFGIDTHLLHQTFVLIRPTLFDRLLVGGSMTTLCLGFHTNGGYRTSSECSTSLYDFFCSIRLMIDVMSVVASFKAPGSKVAAGSTVDAL